MSKTMPQLSVYGRWLLVQRVASGRPVAHVAAELGVSRATGYKWWRRWLEEGEAGLQTRSSRPHSSPSRTPVEREEQVLRLRRDRRLGPARIAGIVGLPASTVHRVLVCHAMPRLAWLDRPSGKPVRYERDQPGELVHVDIKKLGKLREGGWQAHGRAARSTCSHARTCAPGCGRATTSCTARSMTTPAWPTAKSCPTSRARPPPRSGAARRRSSPATASGSSGS